MDEIKIGSLVRIKELFGRGWDGDFIPHWYKTEKQILESKEIGVVVDTSKSFTGTISYYYVDFEDSGYINALMSPNQLELVGKKSKPKAGFASFIQNKGL